MLDVTNLIGFGVGVSKSSPKIVSHTTALNSAGSTSISCAKPSGTQSGDFIIAFLCLGQVINSGVWNVPSGWTSAFVRNQRAILYKVAGGSEPASYTFTNNILSIPLVSLVTVRPASFDAVGTISSATTNPSAPALSVAGDSSVFCVVTQTVANNSNTYEWLLEGWQTLVPRFGATNAGDLNNMTTYMKVFYRDDLDAGLVGPVSVTSTVTARAQLFSCKV